MKAPSAGFWDEWPAGLSLYAGAALAVGLLVVVCPARWGWGVADVRGAVALGQSLSIAEMVGIVAVVGAVVARDHR